MQIAVVDFQTYEKSVAAALDYIKARDRLAKESSILLKPNLVNASPPPVTTSAACCEAIVTYIRSFSTADIVIAEGTGDATRETYDLFDVHGYTKLAARYEIKLIDLNVEPLKKLTNRNCIVFPEFYLPEIAFTHFVVSVPVLKAHSLAIMTGSLKNMMGFAPPEHYGVGYGGWKKAAFHKNMQQAIVDLNRYRSPDLSVMDASIGLSDYHLGGRHCSPPIGKIIAGFDPVAVDRKAAGLLGLDWSTIPHLAGEAETLIK